MSIYFFTADLAVIALNYAQQYVASQNRLLYNFVFLVATLLVFSGRYCFYGDKVFESQDIGDGFQEELIISLIGQNR